MRVLFLGAPGSGKGTQCKKLSAKLTNPHLSSGDLLREAVAQKSAAGLAAKEYMDKGVLVPDATLIDIFKEKLTSEACQGGFILDGFPRNLSQAEALAGLLTEIEKPLDYVICLNIDFSLLTARIAGRRTCSNKSCAAVYHVEFAKPAKEGVCDVCGSALFQRDDDREELVEARLKTYKEQTEPLIAYYDGQPDLGADASGEPAKSGHKLLQRVDGDGEPDVVFKRIQQLVGLES